MNALRALAAELVGLFVEDRLFALAIAAWLGLVGLAMVFGIGSAATRGVVLFCGLAAILLASVARAARTR